MVYNISENHYVLKHKHIFNKKKNILWISSKYCPCLEVYWYWWQSLTQLVFKYSLNRSFRIYILDKFTRKIFKLCIFSLQEKQSVITEGNYVDVDYSVTRRHLIYPWAKSNPYGLIKICMVLSHEKKNTNVPCLCKKK